MSYIFFIAMMKYPIPKIKGGKVYFSSQFAEVSVHRWLPRGGVAWQTAPQRAAAWWAEGHTARKDTALAACFCPFCALSGPPGLGRRQTSLHPDSEITCP